MSTTTRRGTRIQLAEPRIRRRAALAAFGSVALLFTIALGIARLLDLRAESRQRERESAAQLAKILSPRETREFHRQWLTEPQDGSWSYYREWSERRH